MKKIFTLFVFCLVLTSASGKVNSVGQIIIGGRLYPTSSHHGSKSSKKEKINEKKWIKPKIIGIGNLRYNVENDLWYVDVDSIWYNVADVYALNLKDNSYVPIAPAEGMLMTIYTSDKSNNINAIVGSVSVEQIEEIFRDNDENSQSNKGVVNVIWLVFCICLILYVCRL